MAGSEAGSSEHEMEELDPGYQQIQPPSPRHIQLRNEARQVGCVQFLTNTPPILSIGASLERVLHRLVAHARAICSHVADTAPLEPVFLPLVLKVPSTAVLAIKGGLSHCWCWLLEDSTARTSRGRHNKKQSVRVPPLLDWQNEETLPAETFLLP